MQNFLLGRGNRDPRQPEVLGATCHPCKTADDTILSLL